MFLFAGFVAGSEVVFFSRVGEPRTRGFKRPNWCYEKWLKAMVRTKWVDCLEPDEMDRERTNCPFARNRVNGPQVQWIGFKRPNEVDQFGQVRLDILKMTVEVVSRGRKNLKMKCFETRHSCG